MNTFIPVETPGGIIWAEVSDSEGINSVELVSATRKALNDFESVINSLRKNAEYIMRVMKELGPDEVEITFGLTVGAEAGVPLFGLAKANSEASYTLKMKWSSEINQAASKNNPH